MVCPIAYRNGDYRYSSSAHPGPATISAPAPGNQVVSDNDEPLLDACSCIANGVFFTATCWRYRLSRGHQRRNRSNAVKRSCGKLSQSHLAVILCRNNAALRYTACNNRNRLVLGECADHENGQTPAHRSQSQPGARARQAAEQHNRTHSNDRNPEVERTGERRVCALVRNSSSSFERGA